MCTSVTVGAPRVLWGNMNPCHPRQPFPFPLSSSHPTVLYSSIFIVSHAHSVFFLQKNFIIGIIIERDRDSDREKDTWKDGVHTCHDAYMEVRGQLCRFGSFWVFLPPPCMFWEYSPDGHLCRSPPCQLVQRSLSSERAFSPEHSLLGNGGPAIRMLTSPFMGNILLTNLKPNLASCRLAHCD